MTPTRADPTRALLEALPERPQRVGIACSGGQDSTLLLELAARWAQVPGRRLVVLHVQHRLRGGDSLDDEAFVRAMARRLGLPVSVLDGALGGVAAAGIEATARARRYEALGRAAVELGLDEVWFAHHESDQVETILHRLLRGAGPRGLRGMPKSRPLVPGVRLRRPLLAVSKRTIANAVLVLALPFRVDASNADPRFTRNRLRHDLLPRLAAVLPDAEARLLAVARKARATHRAVLAAARRIECEAVRLRAHGLVLLDARVLAPDRTPPAVAYEVVRRALSGSSGFPEIAFERRAFRRLERLFAEPPSLGATTLPAGVVARREGALISLAAPADATPPLALPAAGVVRWPTLGGGLTLAVVDDEAGIAAAYENARRSPLSAILDLDRVDLPSLRARLRRSGDAYRPLGAPGTRRLKRVLRDRLIPRPLRDRLPVIVDHAGLLWMPGLPPADRAKTTTTTRRALALTWSYDDPEPSGDQCQATR